MEKHDDHVVESLIINDKNFYSTLLLIGTIYPVTYDIGQINRVGAGAYFTDFWNLIDFVYMFASIAQVVLHSIYDPFAA